MLSAILMNQRRIHRFNAAYCYCLFGKKAIKKATTIWKSGTPQKLDFTNVSFLRFISLKWMKDPVKKIFQATLKFVEVLLHSHCFYFISSQTLPLKQITKCLEGLNFRKFMVVISAEAKLYSQIPLQKQLPPKAFTKKLPTRKWTRNSLESARPKNYRKYLKIFAVVFGFSMPKNN